MEYATKSTTPTSDQTRTEALASVFQSHARSVGELGDQLYSILVRLRGPSGPAPTPPIAGPLGQKNVEILKHPATIARFEDADGSLSGGLGRIQSLLNELATLV